MRMTLDELINAMEPQARKDKALISKCVDGLTEYAAELRQKAGDAGKEQISALRRLVDELAGYWGLDAKTVDHVTAFDRKIQEVDQAVHQWTPTGQGGLRPLWRKDGAGYQIPWPPTLAV